MATASPMTPASGRTWLGHPRGLFLLFFVEMWERFSFYGMRALLIFYLTQHFLFSDRDAAHSYGAYMSLIYISSPHWTKDNEEYWWAITNPDGTNRPAYDALQKMQK